MNWIQYKQQIIQQRHLVLVFDGKNYEGWFLHPSLDTLEHKEYMLIVRKSDSCCQGITSVPMIHLYYRFCVEAQYQWQEEYDKLKKEVDKDYRLTEYGKAERMSLTGLGNYGHPIDKLGHEFAIADPNWWL